MFTGILSLKQIPTSEGKMDSSYFHQQTTTKSGPNDFILI